MRIHQFVTMIFVVILVPVAAHAQGGPALLEFSFSNPGARSMGFGGAFIALADDATAAFANPAGLVQLVEPEVSVEGRFWGYDTRYTEGGRIVGPPTGIGIDNTAGLRSGVASADLTDFSYLSFVFPIGDWSLAFYRHKAANFEAVTTTQGLFRDVLENNPICRLGCVDGEINRINRSADFRVSTDLDFVTYGFSFGYRVSDRLSLGFGLSLVDGRFTTNVEEFRFNDGSFQSFFGTNSYLPQRQIRTDLLTFDSVDGGFSTGFRYQVTDRVNVGGVFRDGPEFNGNVTAFAGPAHPSIPAGTIIDSGSTPNNFPDIYGLGLSVRSKSETLTFNFDWIRVEHSTFTEDLNPEIFDPIPVISDANELHAGIEYVFLQAKSILALRFGGWFDPDHRLRANVGDPPFHRAFFQRGDDQLHLAGGIGLAFQTFQFDVGVDLSQLSDTMSLSTIFKF